MPLDREFLVHRQLGAALVNKALFHEQLGEFDQMLAALDLFIETVPQNYLRAKADRNRVTALVLCDQFDAAKRQIEILRANLKSEDDLFALAVELAQTITTTKKKELASIDPNELAKICIDILNELVDKNYFTAAEGTSRLLDSVFDDVRDFPEFPGLD